MAHFLEFLAEANSAGSKFEQKIASNVNAWLKANSLDDKFSAKRFQSISEEEGNRDEDYSDVVVENLKTGEHFFIECKQNGNDNSVTNMFDITEDFSLVPVKNKARDEEDDPLLWKLAADIQATDEYQYFIDFLLEETEWTRGGFCPADYYFSKKDINDDDLHQLMRSYNEEVKNGNVESDNKEFDGKLVRESTRNMLAVALMWRLHDPKNTWDICHLDDIPYFGDLIRKHYIKDKAEQVAYMQLADDLYLLDATKNPLNIKCEVFPVEVHGNFDLKFTPRFGTGSMYMTPRSKMTSELPTSCSFASKKKWPVLI